jgi:DNA-binding response OmpR family regulator
MTEPTDRMRSRAAESPAGANMVEKNEHAMRPVQSAHSSSELTMLVIDDEEVVRHSMQVYFGHLGYRVDVASTLEQAEDFVVANEYDLVITDLRLSRIAGHEGLSLLRFVRQTSPATATIVLTAFGSVSVEEEAKSLGVDCFLHKPLPLLSLAHQVSILLERQQRRMQM